MAIYYKVDKFLHKSKVTYYKMSQNYEYNIMHYKKIILRMN